MRLIDADVAIEELTDRSHQAAKRVGTDSPFWEGLVIARRIVNNLPTIQPEPHEGEWANGRCNKCGGQAPFWAMASTYYESDFCPHCGAHMKGATP